VVVAGTFGGDERLSGGDGMRPTPILRLAAPRQALVYAFTGGDKGIEQSLTGLWKEQGDKLSAQYGYVNEQTGLSAGGGFNSSVGVTESELGGSVTAQVTVPLFTGGMNSSLIRQAAELDNVARIGVEGARRQVLQAVSQAWNQLLGARASLAADEAQVKSDTVAYEGVREEQKVGLRTILDVLNAQQELESSQLSLVGARHDEYVAAAAVLAAMGALEASTLAPDAPHYDPKANFDELRHAPGWVPWQGAVHALDQIGAPAPTPAPPPSPPGEVVKTATP